MMKTVMIMMTVMMMTVMMKTVMMMMGNLKKNVSVHTACGWRNAAKGVG